MQAISELKSCVRKILFSEKRQKKLDFQWNHQKRLDFQWRKRQEYIPTRVSSLLLYTVRWVTGVRLYVHHTADHQQVLALKIPPRNRRMLCLQCHLTGPTENLKILFLGRINEYLQLCVFYKTRLAFLLTIMHIISRVFCIQLFFPIPAIFVKLFHAPKWQLLFAKFSMHLKILR
jgi:hypothetical protein